MVPEQLLMPESTLQTQPQPQSPEQAAAELNRLINGYQSTQLIYVAAVLGLADHLAQGPQTSETLATLVEANPTALYRLLRALAALGVLHEHEQPPQTFSLTPMGDCLRSNAQPSIRPWATFVAQPHHWQTWGHLLQSVKTGENAFQAVLGMDSWTYRQQNPEQGAIFNAAMTVNAQRINAAIVSAYDFSRYHRICDIGGGQGALLAAILAASTQTQGTLFDLPHVVNSAGPVLDAAGVAGRCQTMGGSMFDSVPPACNLYLLKFILHDWNDHDCLRILQACRRSMPENATLLVIEYLIGPPNQGLATKLSDLNMLLGPGGQERTQAEFATLFQNAGFLLKQVLPTSAPVNLLVLEPALTCP